LIRLAALMPTPNAHRAQQIARAASSPAEAQMGRGPPRGQVPSPLGEWFRCASFSPGRTFPQPLPGAGGKPPQSAAI
jgi:hypothetical protein